MKLFMSGLCGHMQASQFTVTSNCSCFSVVLLVLNSRLRLSHFFGHRGCLGECLVHCGREMQDRGDAWRERGGGGGAGGGMIMQ